jgi:hypothetical protein
MTILPSVQDGKFEDIVQFGAFFVMLWLFQGGVPF